jgi:hypothetical protein
LNLTLLAKAYGGAQLRQIEELLKGQFEDLDVQMQFSINQQNRWLQVSLEGEDEVVAAAYVRKEIGACPATLDNVEEGTELKGYIAKIEEQRLVVDVGVFEPKVVLASVPLEVLQTQLARGKQVAAKKITEAYSLAEGLPIIVRVTSKAEGLAAELADVQVRKLKDWQQSLLDRLIVLRASRELVDRTLERTRLTRDVIFVEQLGLFEFALTCKLGTDAAGIIPRVGRYMRYAVFVVFNAKKSLMLVGE